MEKSGKYIVVVPYKDLKKMALTDPFSPAGRYHNILTQTDKVAARHPIPDLDFEWTDFQISVLHPNGVAFLTNSAAWKDSLRKISSTIESLEVKRCLRFSPALGSTFALPLKIILGMLNTHLGGKIYIGLNQFGVVEGIKMTRVQQDCFLLGFCKIVTSDIYPSLLPCDSVAHFVPVQQPDAASPQSEFPYYVIILTIQPEPKQVYFPKDHSEKVYMRDGGVTLTLHGSRRAELLSKTHVWAEELEQQVREEKQALLQLALDRSHQH
ncbi:hypothetical protein E2C01_026952 [Portunus trituberculatus]|uniref:Schlafen AlbA-2 domain-containing protein n=1 Tax=Portunus trituberculatus TaxID=210409 RepID=A0A5B7EK79_PORTR|nr:hypothetical protein [Portunus trituberculatus]